MAGYIGSNAVVVSSGAEQKKVFAIGTTTTVLTGLVYSPNQVHVFHNGVRLVDNTDFIATNRTSITLNNAAQNGDEVVVISYVPFQVSDTVSASAGGTFSNDVNILGSVGIGTTTPSVSLEVNSGTTTTVIKQGTSGTPTSVWYSDTNGTTILAADDNNTGVASRLQFNVSGTEGMRIDASGNVGIGTASPSSILHARGPGNPTFTLSGSDGAYTSVIQLTAGGAGGSVINANGGAGALILQTNGSEHIRINSSGNVGIGTTAPANGFKLDVNGAFTVGGDYDAGTATNGGGVNIGFSAANGGSIAALNPGVLWYELLLAASVVKFNTFGVERARFDGNGNFCVGTTGPIPNVYTATALNVASVGNTAAVSCSAATSAGTTLQSKRDTPGLHLVFWQATSAVGSISTNGGSTAYTTTSDPRLKENITPIQGASDIVMAMNPVTYTFKASGVWMDGFLTNEIQTLVPGAVTGEIDGMRDEDYEVSPAVLDEEGAVVTEAVTGTRSVPDYQGMDYSRLTPILTAALQEALNKIKDLEARITALESK
jgi:hypothetical protein